MSKFLVQLRVELQAQNAGGGFRISLCVCDCVCVSAANCRSTPQSDKRASIGLSRTIHNGPLVVYSPAYLLRGRSLTLPVTGTNCRPTGQSQRVRVRVKERQRLRESCCFRLIVCKTSRYANLDPLPIAKSSLALRSNLM